MTRHTSQHDLKTTTIKGPDEHNKHTNLKDALRKIDLKPHAP